jgi:N-dimethylarginine dimethylaminohydrolase
MSPSPALVSNADQLLSQNFLEDLRRLPYPKSVLMCEPDYFDVVDVKNPYMKDQIGKVNTDAARMQWIAVKCCFERIGIRVETIAPVPDCEDMVFAANQVFAGISPDDRRMCILSRMKFPSRQSEVSHFGAWFKGRGYEVHDTTRANCFFEGGGDAIWHPGRGLIWGGYGKRTDAAVYPEIAKLFGVTVLTLELTSDRFYHLDTCFCPVNETTALVHLPSLSEAAQKLIRSVFTNLIEVDAYEATEFMACNASAFGGRDVVLQRGAEKTVQRLRELGLNVHEVETDEFIKSGGSVFCMKTALFE